MECYMSTKAKMVPNYIQDYLRGATLKTFSRNLRKMFGKPFDIAPA